MQEVKATALFPCRSNSDTVWIKTGVHMEHHIKALAEKGSMF